MKSITPSYEKLHSWELYGEEMMTEYKQCIEEGLDVEQYKSLFEAVSKMPRGENKEKMADVIFKIVSEAKTVEGYKYNEPSTIDEIKALRKPYEIAKRELSDKELENKMLGAWLGRICGCLLGKPIEGCWKEHIWEMLEGNDNYPMTRYIRYDRFTDAMKEKYPWLEWKCFADKVSYMPFDDDTNYMVLDQKVIEKYGRDFTPYNMSQAWMALQPKDSYCTAERRAFINFVNGLEPPVSAQYKNAYREWIGAQIRGDYFGYINPQSPELAADMAFRDACISHIKNGIYGEMWASAMIACAFSTDNIVDIIRGGLAQIPSTSRLYERIEAVIDWYKSGASREECFEKIYAEWDDHDTHHWCHTISNAMIVAASLLYGEGDYGKSVCISVQAGFDTDCNGATVGSIVGIINGANGIDKAWTDPINDTLETTIFGVTMVKISECAKKTIEHIK